MVGPIGVRQKYGFLLFSAFNKIADEYAAKEAEEAQQVNLSKNQKEKTKNLFVQKNIDLTNKSASLNVKLKKDSLAVVHRRRKRRFLKTIVLRWMRSSSVSGNRFPSKRWFGFA